MNDCRLSRLEERCFVCGAQLRVGERLYHASYGVLLHHGGPCDALVTAHERVYDRSTRGRWRPKAEVLRRVRAQRRLLALEAAVLRTEDAAVYAMTDLAGFWYRGYVCLPLDDTWRFNTVSEHWVTRAGAHAIIRDSQTHHYPLRLTTLDALLHNWQQYGLWEEPRPLGFALLQRWADLHGQELHTIPRGTGLAVQP